MRFFKTFRIISNYIIISFGIFVKNTKKDYLPTFSLQILDTKSVNSKVISTYARV